MILYVHQIRSPFERHYPVATGWGCWIFSCAFAAEDGKSEVVIREREVVWRVGAVVVEWWVVYLGLTYIIEG